MTHAKFSDPANPPQKKKFETCTKFQVNKERANAAHALSIEYQQEASEALLASTSICLRLLRDTLVDFQGRGAAYGIYMGLEYFSKLFNKPMQRESDFGGR